MNVGGDVNECVVIFCLDLRFWSLGLGGGGKGVS